MIERDALLGLDEQDGGLLYSTCTLPFGYCMSRFCKVDTISGESAIGIK
jgi:hypothetical protein